MSDKIVCQVCSAEVHAIQKHMEVHVDEGWTIERYKEEFPDAPLISDKVRDMLAAKKMSEASSRVAAGDTDERRPLHEVFDLGTAPAAMTPTGAPIPITVMGNHNWIWSRTSTVTMFMTSTS
jgi:cobaltochelatase CobS